MAWSSTTKVHRSGPGKLDKAGPQCELPRSPWAHRSHQAGLGDMRSHHSQAAGCEMSHRASLPWDTQMQGATAGTRGHGQTEQHPPSRDDANPRALQPGWHRAGHGVRGGRGAAISPKWCWSRHKAVESPPSPSSCPRPWAPRANLVPIGASCRAGRAASHAINPQTKGPL